MRDIPPGFLEPCAQNAVAPDNDNEIIAQDGGRHDQRQSAQGVQPVPAGESASVQHIGKSYSDDQSDKCGQAGYAQGKLQGEEGVMHGNSFQETWTSHSLGTGIVCASYLQAGCVESIRIQ
jgi:hypothetical protein